MQNKKEAIFKVGDKVFDFRYGWGVVVENSIDTIHSPIKVVFRKERDEWYSGDGRNLLSDPFPILSFTEYTLEGFSQERPLPNIESGQLVYVKFHGKSEWVMRYFSHFDIEGDMYVYINQAKTGIINSVSEYSITNPLEENE